MKFTRTHEWITEEGDEIAAVGITEHAQKELGEVVYIELPILSKEVGFGEEVCVLESTKAASDIYSPVSGTIVEVNEELAIAPGKINQDPMGKGWLYKIKLQNLQELDHLLTEEEYKALCGDLVQDV